MKLVKGFTKALDDLERNKEFPKEFPNYEEVIKAFE